MWFRNKKTGRVCDAIVRERKNSDGTYSVIVCTIIKNRLGDIISEYHSLAKLYKEWEDYKPAEPLIEDPKARKVFREWAHLFGAERFLVNHLYDSKRKTTSIGSTDITTEPCIELPGHIGEDSEIYTRVELGGEEEE